MNSKGLGLRTLDKTFKAPTEEEIDRSEKFHAKVKQEIAIENYWNDLSIVEKEKLILIHKGNQK